MRAPPRCRLPAALQGLLWITRPIELMDWLHRTHGDVVALQLPELRNVVLLSHPDDIRTVFMGDADVMHAGEGNGPLEPVLGASSVLLLDGRAHLRQRRLMLPSFHGARMQAYADIMRDITRRTIAAWRPDQVFPLLPSMQHITLEVILRTVFGADEREHLDALRSQLGTLLEKVTGPLAPLFLIPGMQRDFGPVKLWTMFRKQLAEADAVIYRQIERRRRARGERADMLALLLEAVDEDGKPMSDQELRDELITLLLAGHETTATALAWAFECILRTPRVLAELRREIDSGATNLPYLDATIKEVLRMRPVVPVVARKLTEPVEIGGYRVEQGVRLAPCIYLAQRNPDRFPRPDSFEPERFLDRKVDPYAWLPFGGGIRRCLGMAFALYEMKTVLATVIGELDMVLQEPKPVRVARRGIIFAPRGGTRVSVRPRVDAEPLAHPARATA